MTRTLPPIIGLNGPAGAGKNTLADQLTALYDYRQVAFAAPLKQIALELDPWISVPLTWTGPYPGAKVIRLSVLVDWVGWRSAKDDYPEVRQFLQALGSGVRRHADPNIWLCAGMQKADEHRRNGDPVVITDMRYPNEHEAVRLRSGMTVRVHRPGLESSDDHESENALNRHQFDAVVQNDGSLHDLAAKAAALHEEALK